MLLASGDYTAAAELLLGALELTPQWAMGWFRLGEMQEASGGRLYPMALLPWWDIDASIKEAERIAGMGLRGVNTTSDPKLASAWGTAHFQTVEADLPLVIDGRCIH